MLASASRCDLSTRNYPGPARLTPVVGYGRADSHLASDGATCACFRTARSFFFADFLPILGHQQPRLAVPSARMRLLSVLISSREGETRLAAQPCSAESYGLARQVLGAGDIRASHDPCGDGLKLAPRPRRAVLKGRLTVGRACTTDTVVLPRCAHGAQVPQDGKNVDSPPFRVFVPRPRINSTSYCLEL